MLNLANLDGHNERIRKIRAWKQISILEKEIRLFHKFLGILRGMEISVNRQ